MYIRAKRKTYKAFKNLGNIRNIFSTEEGLARAIRAVFVTIAKLTY